MTLTPRQQQVLEAARAGLSVKETAQSLALAIGTVKAHRAAIAKITGGRVSNANFDPRAAWCRNCGHYLHDQSSQRTA